MSTVSLCPVNMYLVVGKVVFIFILGIIFLLYFGYPSLVSYLAQETLIIEDYVKFKSEDPPAISIAVKKRTNFHGWKDDFKKMVVFNGTLEAFCNKSKNFNESMHCIKDKTYKLSDVFEKLESTHDNLNVPSFWTENIFSFVYGTVFNSAKPYRIGADWSRNISISLNNSLDYCIWIHDPQYFLTTFNPDTIPHVIIKLKQNQSTWLYLKPVYHHLMNKPDHPCESSEAYSFTACVRNSISRKIGCRLVWDTWSSRDIPLCWTQDQLQQFEKEMYDINDNWEKSVLVEYTGCLTPCHYTQYTLANDPTTSYNSKYINLEMILSSTDILSRHEKRMYSFESFVAEFGGSLGLFLGFSFIMVWDGIQSCVHALWKKIKRSK